MIMKLKCIKDLRYLTKGAYYDLRPSAQSKEQYWVLKDDLGEGGWYHKDSFQTIEDNRNELIENIIK